MLLTTMFLLFNIACKKEASPSNTNKVLIDSVSYKNEITPLLNTYCSSSDCHPDIAVYNNLLLKPNPLIIPFDTANSGLYQSVFTKSMPLSINKLSVSEIGKIRDWILIGAPNN